MYRVWTIDIISEEFLACFLKWVLPLVLVLFLRRIPVDFRKNLSLFLFSWKFE